MKKSAMFLLYILLMHLLHAQVSYKKYPVYKGTDLGLHYAPSASTFRIWSPPAKQVQLLLYKEGEGGIAVKTLDLKKAAAGTWVLTQPGNLKGMFYAFRVKTGNTWSQEVPDPYARAVGINGKRAMVADLADTDPEGWQQDKSPAFSAENKATDAVIYELHIRDASIDASSGIRHKGKYLGLAESGASTITGEATGLSHLKELGVTHIHLLPFYDYNSIDESNTAEPQYNWGYDPLNYNVPEGSYSTNAYDGITRIKELKQMIMAFHKNGMRVVFDAVYNHTGVTEASNFNQLVPGYYYRHNADNSFSDASACGNETASEMPMMQKFMLESVKYWVEEYHIDGFRFDLMGVHDIKTMNMISDALHKIKPDILLYGEGWTAGSSPLPDSLRALKHNAHKLRNIAVFSNDLRDGIKGSVFDINDRGFSTGKKGMEASVKFGIVAGGQHPQVDYSKVNYSKKPYTAAPWNVISYCECHDNNCLWDKIALSCVGSSEDDRKKMHQLALTIVLTSQGIPFLHAGSEFLRTKQGVENSYKSPDSINAINWNLKKENKDINSTVIKLISMRKAHPAFRMQSTSAIAQHLRFDDQAPAGTVIYTINGAAVNDSWKTIWVAFNGTATEKNVQLPPGNWKTALNLAGNQPIHQGHMHLSENNAVILYQDE